MYNPFALLSVPLMQALLKSNQYYVRQTYERGRDHFDELVKLSLLITYYYGDAIETTRAQMHYKLLVKDRYRFLYDGTIPEHRERLLIAASQPEGYKVYVNLLPAKWKAPDLLRDKIAGYVAKALPEWKVDRYSKLDIVLQEKYGNLYLDLHWKGRSATVQLDAVEQQNFSRGKM